MRDEAQHKARVDGWVERTAAGAAPAVRVKLFDEALSALWTRTLTTLGEVTLTAIADRVLSNASEKFPVFAALTVQPTAGIQARALLEHLDATDEAELEGGIRFVLVEFLSVLGTLTAEILTPELHDELSRVGHAEATLLARGVTDSAKARSQGKNHDD